MSIPKAEALAAWKGLSFGERREVLLLAKSGERHPDPDVSAAAYAWSHSEEWDRIMNRVPGWLLPLLGVIVLILFPFSPVPALAVGPAVAIVCGLQGWNACAAAAAVRRAYAHE